MFSARKFSGWRSSSRSSSTSRFSNKYASPRKRCVTNSREEAADEGGFGDAADGEDHGAGAGRDVVLAHGVDHLVEGAHDDLLQARVDFVDVPHQAFLVLYPFEIADGDATGVGKNVRQNGDTAARENFVGVGGGGAVGGFSDNASFDGFGVVQRDDVFERCRDQNVALHGEQLVVREARCAGHADDRARPLLVANGFDGIDAARIGYAAARVAERDDFGFLLGKETRRSGTGVAESLNRDGRAAKRNLFQLAGFLDNIKQPARRSFIASLGTADGDRFAGDHAMRGMA